MKMNCVTGVVTITGVLLGHAAFHASASTVGQGIISDLQGSQFSAKRSVWSVNKLASTDAIGIYQVPFFRTAQPTVADCSKVVEPCQDEKLLLTQPGMSFVRQYNQLIQSAESYVDIASLDSQDGVMLDNIRAALTALARKNKPITVRVMFGSVPELLNFRVQNSPKSAADTLKYITQGIPASSPMKVYVGMYRSGYLGRSWNHAKILSVDGDSVIIGGVNFLDGDFKSRGYVSDVNPVNDMSLGYRGAGLGVPASKFLDNQWDLVCKQAKDAEKSVLWAATALWTRGGRPSWDLQRFQNGNVYETGCPDKLARTFDFVSNHTQQDDPSADYAISLGRLGDVADWQQDASDVAQVSMIQRANSYVRISQQSLYNNALSALDANTPGYRDVVPFPRKILMALCGAMARGVKVQVMTSGEKGHPGAYPYSPPLGREVTYPAYASISELKGYLVTFGGCQRGLIDDTRVLEIRTNWNKAAATADATSFPHFPNHSKVVMVDSLNKATGQVDGRLVYVGSHNTYDQSHAEYGVIVDSQRFASRFDEEFWQYNWNNAR